ncbi:unnamed protein product [Miscanthus lutarioriparius]|uniref:KIB1-4 beta-propeller domain-containing protein n=1 Tax=Miscanthus lutarioriparius TaxID=422564 RepID=A0A811SPX5_9POAL|nr:unnamed protein product [Miscanthus lutarioriparius]
MGLPDQETPQRRSPQCQWRRIPALKPLVNPHSPVPHLTRPLVVVAAEHRRRWWVESAVRTRRVGRKCLRRKRGAAAGTVVGDWADVPADILGTVLGLLPCLADRASVRSVCSDWRAAARIQALPAPLPVLVLPRFIRFSCLTSNGALTAARHAMMPVVAAGDDALIVGSSDDCQRAHRGAPGLALWQPGMTSWYLCRSARIDSFSGDLAFYQGKLEDEHGVSLSCAEHYKINRLIPSKTIDSTRCNLVVWREKLLLIIRFYSDYTYMTMDCKPQSVEVFALDFSTSPCGVTQIHNFDSGFRSFSAGLHVGVQGDLIYFLDECIINKVSYTCVHNMRGGTLRRFAAGLPLPKSGVPKESCSDFPVWMFPS